MVHLVQLEPLAHWAHLGFQELLGLQVPREKLDHKDLMGYQGEMDFLVRKEYKVHLGGNCFIVICVILYTYIQIS